MGKENDKNKRKSKGNERISLLFAIVLVQSVSLRISAAVASGPHCFHAVINVFNDKTRKV
jgi:uncharacterized membrane protein